MGSPRHEQCEIDEKTEMFQTMDRDSSCLSTPIASQPSRRKAKEEDNGQKACVAVGKRIVERWERSGPGGLLTSW
jgi:hypothetical protein